MSAEQWIWVCTDMQKLDTDAEAKYGNGNGKGKDKDNGKGKGNGKGRERVPWAGRCPKPWLPHKVQKARVQAGQAALTPEEAKADSRLYQYLYPASAAGLNQAMADHPDFPWHQLHVLSVNSDDCRSAAKRLSELRAAWRAANPPEVSEP